MFTCSDQHISRCPFMTRQTRIIKAEHNWTERYPRRSLPPHVRNQLQWFVHEQKDERPHADENTELLRALDLSVHPESGIKANTDAGSHSKEESDLEGDEVDEKVREKYDKVVETEEKKGMDDLLSHRSESRSSLLPCLCLF